MRQLMMLLLILLCCMSRLHSQSSSPLLTPSFDHQQPTVYSSDSSAALSSSNASSTSTESVDEFTRLKEAAWRDLFNACCADSTRFVQVLNKLRRLFDNFAHARRLTTDDALRYVDLTERLALRLSVDTRVSLDESTMDNVLATFEHFLRLAYQPKAGQLVRNLNHFSSIRLLGALDRLMSRLDHDVQQHTFTSAYLATLILHTDPFTLDHHRHDAFHSFVKSNNSIGVSARALRQLYGNTSITIAFRYLLIAHDRAHRLEAVRFFPSSLIANQSTNTSSTAARSRIVSNILSALIYVSSTNNYSSEAIATDKHQQQEITRYVRLQFLVDLNQLNDDDDATNSHQKSVRARFNIYN